MTVFLSVHPENPQRRLVCQATEKLKAGGVAVYPTDSYYAFGCLQSSAAAFERIRQLRGLSDAHNFSLLCKDLRQVGNYAVVDNAAFRLIKSHVPGAYTFILKAGKNLERRLYHPSKKTVAFRVPAHPVTQMLLQETGEPIVTTTLTLAGDAEPLAHDEFRERLKGMVDIVLESSVCPMMPTSVVDFTVSPPRLLREGGGQVAYDA